MFEEIEIGNSQTSTTTSIYQELFRDNLSVVARIALAQNWHPNFQKNVVNQSLCDFCHCGKAQSAPQGMYSPVWLEHFPQCVPQHSPLKRWQPPLAARVISLRAVFLGDAGVSSVTEFGIDLVEQRLPIEIALEVTQKQIERERHIAVAIVRRHMRRHNEVLC